MTTISEQSISHNLLLKAKKNRKSIQTSSFLQKIQEDELTTTTIQKISTSPILSQPTNTIYKDPITSARTSRPSLPLSRSKSLDKRDLTINPPLPRFGHSLITKQPPVMRASLQSNPSYSLSMNQMSSEDMSKERISRCRTRKTLMNIPSFQTIHSIVEVEHRFVKTKPLLSYKRCLLKQGVIIKDNGKTQSNRQFFLFNDILVYGAILTEEQSKQFGKELFKQITVSLGNLWIETCVESDLALWMTTEKEHFKVLFLSLKDKKEWFEAIQMALYEYRNRPRNKSLLHHDNDPNDSLSSSMAHFFKALSLPGSPVVKTLRGWTMSRKLSFTSVTSEDSASSSVSWIPDNQAENCMVCQETKFSIMVRKHHCRFCGLIICFKCSHYQLSNGKKIRSCSPCHQKLSKGVLENKASADKLNASLLKPTPRTTYRTNSSETIKSPPNSDKTLLPRSSPISTGTLSDSGSERTFGSNHSNKPSTSQQRAHHISPLNPSHPAHGS
ncbi:hypothetical protein K502DRAFT_325717 [Neoconidiobolus thromboides FSU 785]|nr:hypothetical protein K502DRAFT_325717 [Neoconidiobolus thromboides FSU 785]